MNQRRDTYLNATSAIAAICLLATAALAFLWFRYIQPLFG